VEIQNDCGGQINGITGNWVPATFHSHLSSTGQSSSLLVAGGFGSPLNLQSGITATPCISMRIPGCAKSEIVISVLEGNLPFWKNSRRTLRNSSP
jgi:hypothetical protein